MFDDMENTIHLLMIVCNFQLFLSKNETCVSALENKYTYAGSLHTNTVPL